MYKNSAVLIILLIFILLFSSCFNNSNKGKNINNEIISADAELTVNSDTENKAKIRPLAVPGLLEPIDIGGFEPYEDLSIDDIIELNDKNAEVLQDTYVILKGFSAHKGFSTQRTQ